MSPFIALCFLTAFVSTATSEKGHYYLKCLYDKNQEMPYTGMQLNCDAYRDDGPSPVKQGDEVENAVQNLGNRPGLCKDCLGRCGSFGYPKFWCYDVLCNCRYDPQPRQTEQKVKVDSLVGIMLQRLFQN
ncbi:uncharacterized protein LOC110855033 [Folsomia candida]|uniref:Uncharacterized protein n=1 Tax=Folsomia candida TaxID=158441 RepID=A0A226DWG7_FOLCA|nr:uncharacterized protein LOC110855033 [Folsomia candida]OXA48536.1 hypothetical protein Fcan01_16626 [Folsomia candida]